jgi:hypothetical protein
VLPLQTKDADRSAFAGHAFDTPLQVSAMSHVPTLGRHVTAEVATTSFGHDALTPLHVSATSHTSSESRHVVPIGA